MSAGVHQRSATIPFPKAAESRRTPKRKREAMLEIAHRCSIS
jgi:hypothetical protein